MRDYRTPKYFKLCREYAGHSGLSLPQFAIGATGSGAPFHSHMAAYNYLAFGRKRWFLVSPGAFRPCMLLLVSCLYYMCLVWFPGIFNTQRERLNSLGKIPWKWVDTPSHRKLVAEQVIHECVQNAGDVIFVSGPRLQCLNYFCCTHFSRYLAVGAMRL